MLSSNIIPLIGAVKLSRLTAPMVRAFEDKLMVDRSPAMVRKALGSLSSVLAKRAQERGLVGQNVARGLRARRQRGKGARAASDKGKLKVGVEFRRRRNPRHHRAPAAAGVHCS